MNERYPVVQTIKLIVKVINTYARHSIFPRDRYNPCTRDVPAYVLDYTANTMLQELL